MIEKIKSKILDGVADGTMTQDELTSELAQLEGASIAKGLGLPFCYSRPGEDVDYCEDIDPYVYDGRMSPEDFELMQKLRGV